MRRLQDEVREIVDREGVIARCEHPELSGATDRLLRTGELVPVLPGVCSTATRAPDRDIRLLAVARREPDAVFVDRTAAQLSFWPELSGDQVPCALPAVRAPQRGFRFVKRRVPPELVQERGLLRMTVPALTALDLCGEVEGDEPWSTAERLFHRLLRGARISGWHANREVVVEGNLYYIDVAFWSLKLAIEIDGRLHETDEDLFESDRWRQNALVLDGWMVLRFTWEMLCHHPEKVLRDVRTALSLRRRRFSDLR